MKGIDQKRVEQGLSTEEEDWQSEDESNSEKETYESEEEDENEESDENDSAESERNPADTIESKKAKRMNRQLSTAGFQIFVHHYLSMEWLREYLLKLTVQDLVKGSDEDEEQEVDDEYDDFYNDSRSVEPQLKRTEFYDDLVFLFRTATEWFPTAQVLYAVMKLFEVFEKDKSITAHQFNIDSIYFSVEMSIKASVSSYWKKVATIPLGLQWKHGSLYAKAKAKEMANNITSYETELYAVFRKPTSSHLLETWQKTDHEVRREVENSKTFDDRMKYYQALSVRGRNQGHSEVSDAWNELSKLERKGKYGADKSLLIAWCLQREIDSQTAGKIWRVAAEQLKASSKISDDTVKTARLAFDVEELLSELLETESNMNSLQEQEYSISKLNLVVNEVICTLRSTLIEKDKFITVTNASEIIESVRETLSGITTSFRECIQTFIETVRRKTSY
jgi:chemotaxis protein histidine kinase CheA